MTTANGRLVGLAAALLLAGLTLAGCGSGGSGTVAQKAEQASSTAAAKVQTVTDKVASSGDKTTTSEGSGDTRTANATTTVTQPARTETATETATRSATATVTTTTSGPSGTTSISNSTTGVRVTPTSTTAQESNGGVPWWGWLLIALGAVGLAIAIFMLGRSRGGGRRPAAEDPSMPAAGGTEDAQARAATIAPPAGPPDRGR